MSDIKELTYELLKVFSERRKEYDLSVRDLGLLAGVSYSAIYDFEQRGVLPRTETLFKLAKALYFKVNVESSKNEVIIKVTDNKLNIKKIFVTPKETPEEKLERVLRQAGLHKSEIEEVKEFVTFKLSRRNRS